MRLPRPPAAGAAFVSWRCYLDSPLGLSLGDQALVDQGSPQFSAAHRQRQDHFQIPKSRCAAVRGGIPPLVLGVMRADRPPESPAAADDLTWVMNAEPETGRCVGGLNSLVLDADEHAGYDRYGHEASPFVCLTARVESSAKNFLDAGGVYVRSVSV
ncbi:hypothetical protein [Glycomyces sp. NPDC048151]|uniref:hypothetical protein n=1 Tax=Glycomyces sp. NPDC048151 TaxID=3364002 RepID=UPI0037141A6E